MDVQSPPTEKWGGKKEFMAQDTLEDTIDIWFKVKFRINKNNMFKKIF